MLNLVNLINYCVLANVLEYSCNNNNIRIIKSRRMRWEGFAARMGKMVNEQKRFGRET